MFDKTVTVFNYHENTKRWHTTLFEGVTLNGGDGAKATRQGVTNGDNVTLLLSADLVDGEISCNGKPYLKPKAYAALDDPAAAFTFCPETDFFIVGDYSSDTPLEEAEYMDGLYTEMNAEYDDVYLVTSAAFYSLIPHFEIGGS